MTIVSHRWKFVFIKTRKTAGSSVEIWLSSHLDSGDLAVLTSDLRLESADADKPRSFASKPSLALQLLRRLQGRPYRLQKHSTAFEIREIIGERKWHDYRKITVVRNPFDRTLSRWQWLQHVTGRGFTLDDYLDAIEVGGPSYMRVNRVEHWCNWEMYTIDDKVVVDDVIRYEHLEADLRSTFARLGIPTDRALPNAKTGIRRPGERLSPRQIERIARLHRREIEFFGYDVPPSITA